MARRRTTVLSVLAALIGLLASVSVAIAPSASAANPTYYLALGDSVAFGYTPSETTPPADYLDASNFRGYPEFVGPWYGLRVVNTSCPGETSSSLIDMNKPSNGCENSPTGPTGYRDLFPLHRDYNGNQLAFALDFLNRQAGHVGLVSLNIGANDVFLCQETTSDSCTGADFPATLKKIGRNVRTMLAGIRSTGYTGKIVLLDYYAIDYNDQIQTIGTTLLNNTLNDAASQYNAIIADGYSKFEAASADAGGDPCAAGLLIPLPSGGCNIHPTPKGHRLLAAAISQAISGSRSVNVA